MIQFTVRRVFDGESYVHKCHKCGTHLILSLNSKNINYFSDEVCWRCLELQPDLKLLRESQIDRVEYHFLKFSR